MWVPRLSLATWLLLLPVAIGIYTGQQQIHQSKVVLNPYVYKYLKGYYQNGKSPVTAATPRLAPHPLQLAALQRTLTRHGQQQAPRQQLVRVPPQTRQVLVRAPPQARQVTVRAAAPPHAGRAVLQPKSGVPGGRYRFVQTPVQGRAVRPRLLQRQPARPLIRPIGIQPARQPAHNVLVKPTSQSEYMSLLQQRAQVARMLPIMYNRGQVANYGLTKIPLYGANPYGVFGPNTYGPLPRQTNHKMRLTYNPLFRYHMLPPVQPHPFAIHGKSAYQQQQPQPQPRYPPPAPQPQQQYPPPAPQPQQYPPPAPQPQPQPRYPPPAPQPQQYPPPAPQPQQRYPPPAPQPQQRYPPPAPQPQPRYPAPAPQPQPQSYMPQPIPQPMQGYGDVHVSPCGDVTSDFCSGRYHGHYSMPGSPRCFVQCDHMGRGTANQCAPGTSWQQLGPEPALYNYCA